ncbi:MAG: lipopolysaccharide kinase InaA family protein [Phycisphaerales bacterium]|nr:hypothetical protein [Planctomycetota bacterium]MCH8508664.1 lipopolysaccharide kinase InaA family protein [Phycisphaerales bacterium]
MPNADRRFDETARALSRGDLEGEVLAARPGRVTVRVDDGSPGLVYKLWNLSAPKSVLRRVARRTKGRSEWDALRRLRAAGVAVPEPLAFFRLRGGGVRHHEVLIVEDLSPCESLQKLMHSSSKHGREAEVERLDGEVITLTAAMIGQGVVDNDHRLGNFVVRADGALYRLDFENASRIGRGRRGDERLGVMLGALVSSHAWATRFAPELTPRFVERLLGEIRPGERTLERARSAAAAEISWLCDRSGFTLSNELGW